MQKKLIALMAAVALMFSLGTTAKKVHTIGDSTMADYQEVDTKRGWGMYFGQFLTGGWTSVNYAKGGRDSRGGYNELWQNAKPHVEAGDWVLIQFAHNDEKIGGVDREALYDYYLQKGMTTEAAALDTRGTTPSTTYKEWLKKTVEEVKAKGATPVLVAPVCRCYFSGETITRAGRHDLGDKFSVLTANGLVENQKVGATDHSMDYPYHMRQLATELDVAFIDMTSATEQLYKSYGLAKCHDALFCEGDNTHYNATGALLAARLCAQLMKEQGLLADQIVVPTDLSISPAEANLGDGYKGQTVMKELTLNGFGLSPAEGTITLKATDGIDLSTDKQTWAKTLTVSYKNGTLVEIFYARVVLSAAGPFEGTVTATLGDKQIDVPLKVNVIELGGGSPFSVNWSLRQNDEATVEGTATAGTVSVEKMTKYGNNADKGLMAYVEGGWQKAEDDDPERYIQLSVKAPEGQTLDINHIAMKVGAHGGNGMRCHVYYSTDGFLTRTSIYAPASMASGVLESVTATPVVKLEEGGELQLRVYPWYTSNATGKYICVADVTVSGQSKAAGGINVEGSISYKLDKGGLEQADDAVLTPQEMTAGFAAKKFTAGASLTLNGTVDYVGANNAKTKMTSIVNNTGSSFPGNPTDDNTLTLTLTPEDGFTFVPSKVSFQGARFGTDGGTLTVSAEAGKEKQELCSAANVNRSGKNLDIQQFSFDLSNIMANNSNPLKLNFSFLALGKTKTMGLANLVIEGTLVGSASTATKYVLSTIVEPAGAGSVGREPDLTGYKEGTVVTLTAQRNFGYRFVEWQDAEGARLSTSNPATVTMDGEKTVKAVFEKVPIYNVTTRVTNDADRSLGAITLTPNDHNGQYEAGEEITATAVESKILKFMQWTDGNENAGTAAVRSITVNKDMELVANYEVQDFVAVFDASANNYYAYPSTSGYPFPADLSWDNERNASASVVKVGNGELAYTQEGGTPVVRNREGVVLSTINGLYQNGYRTTDIAFQYQFSTKGFTAVTFTADMAAKNMASKNWKALISTDGGQQFEPIEGATWPMTANSLMPLSFELPAKAVGQADVRIRITGDGEEMLSGSYQFDQTFDGLAYTSHSESGVGNVYVVGTAEVVEDHAAPVVTNLLPAHEAKDVSASGRITISYDERIQAAADCTAKATLAGNGETVTLEPTWNSRSVSFSYFALAYGQTYTFTLPAGYVEDRSGNKAAAQTITFTTMERRQPEPRVYDAIVATDGTGDYTTVQAAVNAAPAGRGKPWLIFIKNGRYKEHIDIPETKPYLHFTGQSRDGVVILDDKLCGGDNALHVSVGATVVVHADNTFFENLTLENSYGHERQTGPQALALNTIGDRIVLNKVALLSYQDTWITTGNQKSRHYIKHSLIEGAVDFIYNGGDVYLDGDTLEINRPSGGYIVAPWHTAETRWGYVFQNNVIRARKGIDVKDVWLGRPWHGQPKTVFINTQTYVSLPAKGWYNTMGGLPALWAEYNTVDANGQPLDLSQRETYYYYTDKDTQQKYEVSNVKNQLTAEEAAEYTVKNVMGGSDQWQPNLLCEACEAPKTVLADGKLRWTAVPYAICYVVTKNGSDVFFTTQTETEAEEGATYRVQAVNEFGGLSDYSTEGDINAIRTVTVASGRTSAVFGLDGKRLSKSPKGISIERCSDGAARKIIR